MGPQADPLTPAQWEAAARRQLRGEPCRLLDCSLRPLRAGAGFLGEHRFAELQVQPASGSGEPRTLHFFVKTVPKEEGARNDFLEQLGTGKKEIRALTTLVKDLADCLGPEFPFTCECFHAQDDVIVLQNLVQEGMSVSTGREPFTYEHCVAALKALANFHAGSFILEARRSATLDTLYPGLLEEFFFLDKPGQPGYDAIESSLEGLMVVLEHLLGAEEAEKVRPAVDRLCWEIVPLQKPSQKFRNVACHGDLWQTNVFFRQEGGAPAQALYVDFQFLRYAPPANDVCSLLHLTTAREFRERHFPALLREYHRQLGACLRAGGLDPERELPWAQLEASCQHYRRLGVVVSALYSITTMVRPEDWKHEFKNDNEITGYLRLASEKRKYVPLFFERDPMFKARLSETVLELLDIVKSMKLGVV